MDELLERVGFARSVLEYEPYFDGTCDEAHSRLLHDTAEFRKLLSTKQKYAFLRICDLSISLTAANVSKSRIDGYLLGVETVVRGLSAVRDEINWDEEWLIELFTDFIEEKEA